MGHVSMTVPKDRHSRFPGLLLQIIIRVFVGNSNAKVCLVEEIVTAKQLPGAMYKKLEEKTVKKVQVARTVRVSVS